MTSGGPTPSIVDASDYTVGNGNFGAGAPGSLGAGTVQIPEPSSVACILVCLMLASGRLGRRTTA